MSNDINQEICIPLREDSDGPDIVQVLPGMMDAEEVQEHARALARLLMKETSPEFRDAFIQAISKA